MIRVLHANVADISADAFVRTIGADLEACSTVGNAMGLAAGADALDPLRAIGELDVGGVVVTAAGALQGEFLIHIVIRSIDEPVSEDRVARAFRNGLRQAADWGVTRLAVPPLGMGPGNLDAERSARVMCRVFADHRKEASLPSEIVIPVETPYEAEVFSGEAARLALEPST